MHKYLRLSVTGSLISGQTGTYTKVVNDRFIRHRNKLVSRILTPKVGAKRLLKVIDPKRKLTPTCPGTKPQVTPTTVLAL